MAIQLNSNMTVIQVLEGTNKEILANINLIEKDFFEKTGRKLNKGCSACVIEAVLTLKNHYKMTQFKFKRHAASYKNKKGDKTTISNSTMTDEKAIEFLKTKPSRIELFSEYPSNWNDLIEGKVETEKEKEARLAIEAERKAAEDAKLLEQNRKEAQQKVQDYISGDKNVSEGRAREALEKIPKEERVHLLAVIEKHKASLNDDKNDDEDDSEKKDDSGAGEDEKLRKELEQKTLTELRGMYPDIKAVSQKDFIDKVLAS